MTPADIKLARRKLAELQDLLGVAEVATLADAGTEVTPLMDILSSLTHQAVTHQLVDWEISTRAKVEEVPGSGPFINRRLSGVREYTVRVAVYSPPAAA